VRTRPLCQKVKMVNKIIKLLRLSGRPQYITRLGDILTALRTDADVDAIRLAIIFA
jgi:hypothetical protein